MGSTRALGTDGSQRPRRRLPIKLIVGAVSAFLLVSTALDLGPAVRAGLHDGTRGLWVATSKTCRGSACIWAGKFVTPGGHVVLASTRYAGPIPGGVRAGTRVPALFTGGSGVVFPTTGSDLWIEMVVALLASLLGLFWATRARVAQYLRERRPADGRAQGGRDRG
jgi:hypothetical protein